MPMGSIYIMNDDASITSRVLPSSITAITMTLTLSQRLSHIIIISLIPYTLLLSLLLHLGHIPSLYFRLECAEMFFIKKLTLLQIHRVTLKLKLKYIFSLLQL